MLPCLAWKGEQSEAARGTTPTRGFFMRATGSRAVCPVCNIAFDGEQ